MTSLLWLGLAVFLAGVIVLAAMFWGEEERRRTSLEDFMGKTEEQPWTQRIFKRMNQGDMGLAERLVRAGLPFRSIPEYYSAMLAYGVGTGAIGALLGWVLFNGPIGGVVAGVLFAYLGMKQPDMRITQAMKARSETLFRDIFFGIPELQRTFRVYQNATAAIEHFVQEYHIALDEGLPEDHRKALNLRREQSQATASHLIANALRGAGGNLFAEALNRFAEAMLRNIPPAEAMEETLQYYPPLPQLLLVLNTIVQAVGQGISPDEALGNIRQTMRLEMERRISNQTSQAAAVVLGVSAMLILAVVLLFSVPLITQLNF